MFYSYFQLFAEYAQTSIKSNLVLVWRWSWQKMFFSFRMAHTSTNSWIFFRFFCEETKRKKYSEALRETPQTWWGCRWRRSAKYNQCHCCIRTFRSCINCYNWSTGIRRLIILYIEKWLGYNDVIAEVCETHSWPNCIKCKSGYAMLNVGRVGGQALK